MNIQTDKEDTKQHSTKKSGERKITPLNSIRQYCLRCCCDSMKEIRLCPAKDCILHPFRLGKNPFQTHRELTDEEKQLASARFGRAKRYGTQ